MTTKGGYYPVDGGELPPRQQECLDYCTEFYAKRKRFPSGYDVAQHMGWKSSGAAHDCLLRLVWRGKLFAQRLPYGKWEFSFEPFEDAPQLGYRGRPPLESCG